MMTSSSFCLKWDNFQSSLSRAFDELRAVSELTDLTLCCDDGRIDTHQVILSACSPYFRQIININRCQKMVFFIKDVSIGTLRALVDFMYRGSVNLDQNQLNVFLKTANILQIRGLSVESGCVEGAWSTSCVQSPEGSSVAGERKQQPALSSVVDTKKRSKSGDNAEPKMLESAECCEVVCESERDENVEDDEKSAVATTPIMSSALPTQASRANDDGVMVNVTSQESSAASSSCKNTDAHQSGSSDVEEISDKCSVIKTESDWIVSYDGDVTNNTLVHQPHSSYPPAAFGDSSSGYHMIGVRHHMSQIQQRQHRQQLNHPYTAVSNCADSVELSAYQMAARNISALMSSQDPSGGMFVCNECGKQYSSRVSLLHHEKVHSGLTQCKLCGKVSSTVAHLRRHLSSAHSLSPPQIAAIVPGRRVELIGVPSATNSTLSNLSQT